MSIPLQFDHVEVTGEATTLVSPDLVTVSFTISASFDNPVDAKRDVENRCRAAWDLTKRLDVQSKDITSSEVRIEPEWRLIKEEDEPARTSVSASFVVVLRDLDKFNDLIDGLVAIPLTELGLVRFNVANRDQLEQETVKKAVLNAKVIASAAAESLGRRVGAVHRLSTEPVEDRQQFYASYGAEKIQKSDWIQIGDIVISRKVYCTFRFGEDIDTDRERS